MAANSPRSIAAASKGGGNVGPVAGARLAAGRIVVGAVPAYLISAGTSPMRDIAARPQVSRPLLAASVVVALALIGAVLLWAHYGTTVFFETIRAGFTACFG